MQYKSSFFFNYFQFFLIDVVAASQSLNHLPNPANHPAEGACTTPITHLNLCRYLYQFRLLKQ